VARAFRFLRIPGPLEPEGRYWLRRPSIAGIGRPSRVEIGASGRSLGLQHRAVGDQPKA